MLPTHSQVLVCRQDLIFSQESEGETRLDLPPALECHAERVSLEAQMICRFPKPWWSICAVQLQ